MKMSTNLKKIMILSCKIPVKYLSIDW